MDVEEITGRLSLRFGPAVAEWCARGALAPMVAIAHLDDDAARTDLLTLAA
ncbi:hypothetical protein ACQPYE_14430 [Actinosynnema sp. CA-299493]